MLATLRFDNVTHPWLWLILVLAGAAVLVSTYWGIFQRSERRLSWVLMLLRGAGLLALVLCLARPTWTNEVTDPDRLPVIVDNSLSMSLADPSGQSRFALARQAAERLRRAVESDRSGPPRVVEFFDITGNRLEAGLPEQPAVERTDLVRALTETTARLRSRPVVLISDGMDNTNRPDLRELNSLRVPVFTVGFRADPAASSLDLAVRKPRAPERVMVHNEIKVEVPVAKTGGPAVQATVVLKRGRDQVASQKVNFEPGNGEQLVALNFTPTQPGSFVFTAAVKAETGERLQANNAVSFPLRVDAEPIRVLYLEGFLRYEHKFLKARLEDDPDVSLVTVVRRINPERTETKTGKDLLLTPDSLKKFDVVILGDMEAKYLSTAEYQALVKWLDEKSHALLVLGGYHSFGPDGFRTTPLADVLPVVFVEKGPVQSEDPFQLELTEEGRRHPIFEVAADRVQNETTWKAAPHLLGSSLVQRAKPAATVLAVNPGFVIEDKPAVVAAVQPYGGGQTMVLTADTTWQWSRLTRLRGQADTLFSRFWSQTVRWLAGRGTDDQRPLLVASTDRPAYDAVGKPVNVRVARQPRPNVDLTATEVGVEVIGPDGKAVPVPVRAGSKEPDVFEGSFTPAAGGRYELAATLTAKGQPMANQVTEFRVYSADLELADSGTNPEALRGIARDTGGLFFEIEEADRVANKIPGPQRRVAREQTTEFWNSPWLFFFFLGAVTGEWLIRRRNHLV